MILVPLTADVAMERVPWMNWTLILGSILLSIYAFYDVEHALTDAEVAQMADYYEQTQPRDLEAINRYMTHELTQEQVKWTAEDVRQHVYGQHAHPLALHPAAFHSWQLLTYTFVNTSWLVLLINMLFLFCFGNAINAKLGHLLFLFFYVAFAVLSGLVILLAARPVPMLGSSAAIMGLFGLFLVFYPRNDVRLYYWVWAGQRFNGICAISAIWFILGFILLDAIWFWRKVISGPAFLADLFSLFVGMCIAMALLLTGWFTAEEGEENLLQMMGWASRK